ncbi:hypothetical protein STAN_1888 [Streptomyces sp. CBMAI 2042]|nr:hypothetical protein STAN_1888 [Streptomyces sp. CBMAI 2042]
MLKGGHSFGLEIFAGGFECLLCLAVPLG